MKTSSIAFLLIAMCAGGVIAAPSQPQPRAAAEPEITLPLGPYETVHSVTAYYMHDNPFNAATQTLQHVWETGSPSVERFPGLATTVDAWDGDDWERAQITFDLVRQKTFGPTFEVESRACSFSRTGDGSKAQTGNVTFARPSDGNAAVDSVVDGVRYRCSGYA